MTGPFLIPATGTALRPGTPPEAPLPLGLTPGASLWHRRLTVGVKHLTGEPHLGGAERVIQREAEDGRKHPELEAGVLGAPGREQMGEQVSDAVDTGWEASDTMDMDTGWGMAWEASDALDMG